MPKADQRQRLKRVGWKHNALRHSFISYRVAAIQNLNQVALEAGNSTAMIFKHYRELVTPDEAKEWFSITPRSQENVIPITKAEQCGGDLAKTDRAMRGSPSE